MLLSGDGIKENINDYNLNFCCFADFSDPDTPFLPWGASLNTNGFNTTQDSQAEVILASYMDTKDENKKYKCEALNQLLFS